MQKTPLYTIGHGTRKEEDFVALLKEFSIQYLVDVRSRPYSGYNPQFNREHLKTFLSQYHIRYVFMGDQLGGKPEDPSCYNEKGKVDYAVLKTKDFFSQGIERLKTAYHKNMMVAVMCSEYKPAECHRGRLIAPVLHDDGMVVQHIDENGKLKDHLQLMKEIYPGPTGTLFTNE